MSITWSVNPPLAASLPFAPSPALLGDLLSLIPDVRRADAALYADKARRARPAPNPPAAA